MPAKKTKSVKLSQAEKANLAKLRKRGLYKPKDARKPTKYAKSLLRKFADVLSGNAGVVEVDAETAKRYRDKSAKSSEIRSKGNKVIVPKLPGEKISFSRKRHEIDVSRRMKTGERYVRSPFRTPPKDYEDLARQLGPKDRIAVAYYRGVKNPVEWQYFDETDFYNTFVGGYSNVEGEKARTKALNWALKHSMVSRFVPAKK